ncbi:isochorismate synthase [Virgibacillus profundi]|uniref:Isochorismate synthase MenF n=1 Tax=Virgibacillus profundi TaxID=2024555 RepID=A0A2A2I9J7_9BACI|nr:isochorismate synthase [Virgibacillus profundi]PAV27733.1 isochorismate synthase [Virgibacillus profundi]PXY51888.1 isochorismate synthase [Virgibacillus profundi]
MIEIKEKQLEHLLDSAIKEIQYHDELQLVSITKEISYANPFHFFDKAKAIGKDRTFWTSTGDQFYLVGAGNAYEIIAEDSRFEGTEEGWNNLINEAIIHNKYKYPGTGIVALGGMSFDPRKAPSDLWNKFKPSQFTIPEYMLTIRKNNFYFTANVFVKKDDHSVQLANDIKRHENELISQMETSLTAINIKDKKEIEPDKWKETVRYATEEISDHKAEKIVLAREIRLKFDKQADIGTILNKLIDTQSNSYIFAFEKGEDCFVGATPERLVRVENKRLLSTCLAGTAPRGKTKEEDERISHDLLNDEKNRQEHDFVVKMINHSIKNHCTNIKIPDEPVIYPLKNLQHLYTPVTAKLKDRYSIFDIIKQLHPTPALGGTPRTESLAFIREHELLDRGWYGAPVGWLDSNQNGEFAVAIRSGLIQGDEASLFAGCGVVKDSDPEAEYEETNIKFLPMLSVLGG